jgi:hypothetical protein
MVTIQRLVLCILPFGLTPLIALLIAEGYLNFGGGEKDLLLLIPWIIWSFIYLILFIVQWIKGAKIKKTIFFASGGATALIVLLWIGALIFSISKIGIK